MTHSDLPPVALSIERAITSNSCTSATVNDLRRILGIPNDGSAANISTGSKLTVKAQRHAVGAIAKTKTKGTKPLSVLARGSDLDTLEPAASVRLATLIVNSSLKALTGIVREQSLLAKTSKDCQPLQPLSPNRQANGARCGKLEPNAKKTGLSQDMKDAENHVTSLAECAQVALEALRKDGEPRNGSSKRSIGQIELGMSSLVGKLLLLGMDNLASTELCSLFVRLQQHSSGSKISRTKTRSTRVPETRSDVSLADFISLDAIPKDLLSLELTITSQVQALKLLSKSPKLSSIERILHHLENGKGSTLKLIESVIAQDPPNVASKSSKWLDQIAQAFDMLGGLRISPEASQSAYHNMFRCRNMASRVRLRSWILSNEGRSLQKQVLDPFTSHMSTFAQNRCIVSVEKYATLSQGCRMFLGELKSSEDKVSSELYDITAAKSYRVLADVARENRNYKSAFEWLEKAIQIPNLSSCVSTALDCLLASTHIQQSLAGQPTESLPEVLRNAIKRLKQELHGSAADMDDVLVSTASLRKYAVNMLVNATSSTTEHQMDNDSSITEVCKDIVLCCVKFFIRYARSIVPHQKDQGERRNDRQLGLIMKSLAPSVEALAAATRALVNEKPSARSEELQCLQECQSLISDLDLHSTNLSSALQRCRHPLITISNVFWSSYQEKKSQGSRLNELVQLLQRSVDALSACSSSDQDTGFLFLKFEKLGGLLESNGDFNGATSNYANALQVILASPAMLALSTELDIFTAITSKPLKGSLARLRPLISSYVRTQVKLESKAGRQFVPFRSQLCSASEGWILELQLAVGLESLSADGGLVPAGFFTAMYSLLKQTYATTSIPLLRVHLKLMQGLCIATDSFPPGFAEALQEDFDALSSGLASHGALYQHAINQNEVLRFIFTRDSSKVTVFEILSSWHRQSTFMKRSDEGENDLQSPESLNVLQLLQKYLFSTGNETWLALVTETLMNLLQDLTDESNLLRYSAIFSQQMTRLGHCEQAQKCLFRAERLIERMADENRIAVLEWQLSHAEYLLEINNTEKCREMLASADTTFQKIWTADVSATITLWDRYQRSSYAAQIMYIGAGLSKAEGNAAQALYYAKKATRLIHRAWSILERHQGAKTGLESSQSADAPTTSHPGSVAEASPIASTEHSSLKLASFWMISPLLYSHTARLAYLLTDEGQLLEAQYYSDKAHKLAKATGSLRLQAGSLILKSHIARLANEEFSDLENLQSTVKEQSGLCYITQADVELSLAASFHKSKDYEGEITALKRIEVLIDKSLQPPSNAWHPESSTLKDLDKSMAALSINSQSLSKEPHRTVKPSSRNPRKNPNDSQVPNKTNAALKSDLKQEVMPLLRRQARRLRQSATLSAQLKDFHLASTILEEARIITSLPLDAFDQNLCDLAISIRWAIAIFAKDPVLSLIQESSITCPSVSTDECMGTKACPPPLTTGKTSRPIGSARRIDASIASPTPQDEIVELLSNWSSNLLRACTAMQAFPTTAMGHACADSLFKAQLLLSAAAPSIERPIVSPISLAYSLEYGRCLAYMREGGSISGDRQLDMEKDTTPASCLDSPLEELATSSIDVTSFQSDYIDIIHPKWTVLSVSISADHEELRISRFRPHRLPFSLSIPLSRHNPRDCEDEEPFSFDEGKAELLEIISLANYSAHEGVDITKKGAKTAWWETRAALDARLKDLVNNIQNLWIGGFRGMFSKHDSLPELLGRFKTTLHNILGKYLPSRQRTKKTAARKPVDLDVQVLELFIGLGNPVENEDLEEALLDLFYFVVDILQFHGERNAYDEIDFDPMILETLEALTHYHNAATDVLDFGTPNHVILVLDKSLHAFPWESLPCLEGRSVSRLPSLSCLRDRILMQQSQVPSVSAFQADAGSGTYILNPAGDLASTHKTFSSQLSALTEWNAIVKSAPTENDITTALSSKSLYLYFGHGSGAQYVRSRAIRKLERCAVAILMGCSSGSLTEAGDLESYGPLMAYLHAGSPAVVGTLWDVTDKDIDRFAMNTLERWGLFGSKSEASEKGKGRKLKSKQSKEHAMECTPVSLDEAVAESRRSCILKYLNGAAPVVYGIPVMLK